MRKLLAIVVGVCVVAVSAVAGAQGGQEFSDVPEDSVHGPAIEWAAKLGITTGTSLGKFSPDAPLTRGQAVTFLHRYDKVASQGIPSDNELADAVAKPFGECTSSQVQNKYKSSTSFADLQRGAVQVTQVMTEFRMWVLATCGY